MGAGSVMQRLDMCRGSEHSTVGVGRIRIQSILVWDPKSYLGFED